MILTSAIVANADTLYLKDGTILYGEIMSKTSEAVVIKSDGIPRKFYIQQVDSIDESTEEEITDNSLKNLRELSEIPENKVKMILKFLEVEGTKRRLHENLKKAIANAPDEKQQQLKDLISVDEILNELVSMYDKIFKQSELEELVLFYESFAGQKLIEITPIVLDHTVKITYEYVRSKFNAAK